MIESTESPKFQIQSISTFDKDHLSEMVAPWNLFLKKLDKNKSFHAFGELLLSKNFVLGKTDFSNTLHQTGSPPDGMRTFWVPMDADQHFYWRNFEIKDNNIGFFPLGAELEAITKNNFRVCVISFSEKTLISVANKLKLDWISIVDKVSREYYTIDSFTMWKIRMLVNQIYALQKSDKTVTFVNRIFEEFKNKIIELFILDCLDLQKDNKPDISNRTRIFKKFQEYIYTFPQAQFSCSDLCVFTGSSERTLQYVVKYFTQLTPNQYVKAMKLNIVRDYLIKGNPYLSIGQLAIEYGFWHKSQFASDYFNHFRELPSESLKKHIG